MLSNKPFEVPSYLLQQADALPASRTAVAGADSAVALESARAATDVGVCEPILIGNEAKIRALADDMAWDITAYDVIAAEDEVESSKKAVAEARRGAATALMKGHVHTDAIMRAVVNRETGLRTGRRLSHIFHMTVPGSDKVLHLTDCAVNVAPDADTMIQILNNAAELARALGTIEPKVGVLSATETPSPAMPSSLQARDVVARAAAGEVPDAVVGGPFAFDNAVSPAAAALKKIDHPAAGVADIVVVPNIETGNALFKMMVWFMSATAAGLVMGAKVPIVLTSRADPPEARLAAAIIASIVAGKSAQ